MDTLYRLAPYPLRIIKTLLDIADKADRKEYIGTLTK